MILHNFCYGGSFIAWWLKIKKQYILDNYTNTHKIGGTISDNGNASISNLSVDTNIGIYTIINGKITSVITK